MPMMQMPSMIRLGLNISRPRITIMPTPFFRPTISAASTAIQAAKKLMRSMVNTCGSTAGKITRAQTCGREAPKVRAVFTRRWSTDCTAATVESVSRKNTPVNTTNTAVGLPMPKMMIPTGIQAIGAIGARPRTIGSTAAEAQRDIETRIPVATAATKPMNRPATTRNALARIAAGIVMPSWPKPTRKSLSMANLMNDDGGGNSVVVIQPRAAASSHSPTRTSHGTSAAPAALSSSIPFPFFLLCLQRVLEEPEVDQVRRHRLDVAQLGHVGDRHAHPRLAVADQVHLRALPRQRGAQGVLVDAVELGGVEHIHRLGRVGLDLGGGPEQRTHVFGRSRRVRLEEVDASSGGAVLTVLAPGVEVGGHRHPAQLVDQARGERLDVGHHVHRLGLERRGHRQRVGEPHHVEVAVRQARGLQRAVGHQLE